MKTLCDNDESAPEILQTFGAPELLIKGMNKNSNDIAVVSACAKSLGNIKGGSNGVASTLANVKLILTNLENGDASMLVDFINSMQLTR